MTRFLTLALLCALIAACGGGETPEASPAAADGRKRILATAQNSESAATTLTVRAHAVLAGNVGALMQVLVDGQLIQTVEVRATEPTDYHFPVPAMQAGRKVDVVFTNDGVVGGVDRNLYIAYVIAGDTYALPNSPIVSYDRGTGAAAFDGVDVLAGQTSMSWGGALRIAWPAPNLTERLTVRASGRLAGDVGPRMEIRFGNLVVGSTEVRSTHGSDHIFAVPPLSLNTKLDVVFTNDAIVNGVDRELRIDYLMTNTTVVRPTGSGITYDIGSGAAAFDGANVQSGSGVMPVNGALRIKWGAPNMTDSLTVRASGTLAANVGPIMEVHVDGVVVGTTEVRNNTATDYTFAALPLQPGSQVDVVFVNDAVIQGEDRNLIVGYAITSNTLALPSSEAAGFDAGTGTAAFDGVDVQPGKSRLTSNGALRINWPAPNRTDRITVDAKASLAANIGAAMQVLVDDVVVGTAEVRSIDYGAYSFPTVPIQPGSKVDVVFLNDQRIGDEDRNLYVASVVAGPAYVLPTTPGTIYDRGVGTAAFDGIDVIAGRNSLTWSGALRWTWPPANITDTLTVRASGSLAANTGPLMQVRVDGITVAAVEVRATTPTDYQVATPPLRPGSKVDIVFSNDANVDGADRNLYVAYLLAGNTYLSSSASGVVYDKGNGAAAFDGLDTQAGQSSLTSNGALRGIWPAPNATSRLTVRASATLADNVGAMLQVRINGVIFGTVEVRSSVPADHEFFVPTLTQGSTIDIAFINDAVVSGQDRNLYVYYINTGSGTLMPTAPGVELDIGTGEAAFDGINTAPGAVGMNSNGALRYTMPALPVADPTLGAQYAAARFLQQATFGPTTSEITRLVTTPYGTWINEQMAIPAKNDYVNYVQGKYDIGDAYRPGGTQYSTNWVSQRFWATAAQSPDQLRKRVAYALHHIFMVSQADGNLNWHSRAYANYLDKLNQHAFGNFRTLLEEMALSPIMGMYLSHMQNLKEDPVTGRLPDENFAREVMQLFTIGLHELNTNGTPKLDSQGQPIETYNNNDVMALAKVFTGWSWAFPDNQLTDSNYLWGKPDYSAANDLRIDLQKMKAYPGQHSSSEKRLFTGKAHAVVIPANSTAQDSVRLALDALFKHPNVGPFIGRQLIQRLVTSHPSPAYVGRVATKFNNNGSGVRGDMAAVVRAILMDSEARTAPAADEGKLREPVLRVAHWMRSFGATSASGEYLLSGLLKDMSQRAMFAPSVFGYFRSGYVPPNTVFSSTGTTMPELQIVNETTTASWVNMALAMAGNGLGSSNDVTTALSVLVNMSTAGQVDQMIQHLNLLLFAGRMSDGLRQGLLESITTVSGTSATTHQNRARVALFVALCSPEYMVQR